MRGLTDRERFFLTTTDATYVDESSARDLELRGLVVATDCPQCGEMVANCECGCPYENLEMTAAGKLALCLDTAARSCR